MARMDSPKVIESIEITGSGKRFEQLLEIAPSRFSMMEESEVKKLKVHVGENPEFDTNIWIRKHFSTNLQENIDELNNKLYENRNLEMIAVEHVNLSDYMPDYFLLIARDGAVKTFQTSEDLNNFLLERFKLNLAI